jgi:hypothetical protein
MPANLTTELKRTQAEKSALVATIVAYEKEIEQVRAKYEADKKRWADLKNPPGAKAADATPPAPRPQGSGQEELSSRRRTSFTCAGFAFPCRAPMTLPTSALKAFSLPAR